MSFDEDPASPDKMVNPQKRTTKVNFAVVAGIVVFLLLGIVAVLLVARYHPN
jgi:hypothetical protein